MYPGSVELNVNVIVSVDSEAKQTLSSSGTLGGSLGSLGVSSYSSGSDNGGPGGVSSSSDGVSLGGSDGVSSPSSEEGGISDDGGSLGASSPSSGGVSE